MLIKQYGDTFEVQVKPDPLSHQQSSELIDFFISIASMLKQKNISQH